MTIVVTNGNYFAGLILKPLLKKYKKDLKVLIITVDYYGNSKKKALIKASKNVAIKFIFYKIFVFFGISFLKIFKKGSYSVSDICKDFGIETYHFQSVNSDKVESILSKSEDYLVSVSCPQIVKADILRRFKFCINIHSSLLPQYAGLAPYFWVLKNSEITTGTTVHYMSKKLDQGNILVQQKIQISPDWSMFKLFVELSKLGSVPLLQAYEKLRIGEEGIKQDSSKKSYYSNPQKKDLKDFQKRGKKLITIKDILSLNPL